MNYLAHLSLSFDVPQVMLGNFIADNMRMSNVSKLPPLIRYGVLLHRSIDQFTDDHPSFHETAKRLKTKHKRYATVVIDILNDHLLSLNWNEFHLVELKDFRDTVYDQFEPLKTNLTDRSLRHLDALLTHQYLLAYETKIGMMDILHRMDRRTKFPSNFVSGMDDLYADFDFYNAHFLQLYSDLIQHIAEYKDANPIH